ncbi:MAG: DMT family transporter [Eubacteriales bacterium]
MWFFFALAATLAWGAADLFYKKGANESDRYSHLKTAICVGAVMGLHALYLLLFRIPEYNFLNLLIYLPVSLMYILSMVIGYLGLRYLELSVSSPVQNASGAVAFLLTLLFLGEMTDLPTTAAIICILVGVFLLGYFEKKKQDAYVAAHDRKYKIGFVAFFLPILYCIIDALGTFFDAYYTDDVNTTFLRGVTEDNFEDVANASYELTFLFVAVCLLVYLVAIKKQKFDLFEQKDRTVAALFETGGQLAYIYAIVANALVAIPMISAYCMVSVLLSRVFLRERLERRQYVAVAVVILGIVGLGVLEGLGG